MVSAPTNSLPALNQHEQELLAHFLILRYDFVALAESRKLLPEQLLAFAESRAVAAHLAAFKSFAETAVALRHLEARIKSLDILERIATTSESPIEQRRAASTIFRGIGLQRDRQSPSEPSGASRRSIAYAPGEHASHSGGSRRSVLTPDSPPRPRRSIFLPPIPTSPSAPSRTLPASEVLHHINFALSDHDKPESDGIIEAFLAEEATINGTPARNQSVRDLISRMIPKGEIVQTQSDENPRVDPGPPETLRSDLWLIHNGGRQTRISINLARAASGPLEGAWLITSLARHLDTS
jgi:hypothetical protein